VPGAWIDLDLSTAVFNGAPAGDRWGEYDAPNIVAANGFAPAFHFVGLTLDDAEAYEFEATFVAGSGDYLFIDRMLDNSDEEFDAPTAYYSIMAQDPAVSATGYTVGPGVESWDAAVTAGYDSLVFYTTDISALRYRTVADAEPAATLVGNRAEAVDIDGGAKVTFSAAVATRPALTPAGGADIVVRAITDNPTDEGFSRPEFTEVRRPRHRTRILAGGQDWTFKDDIPTPAIDFEYVIPLGYGPGTMRVPQFDGRFDTYTDAKWKRIREQKTVKSQRVDDDPSSETYGDVVATDWVGFVIGTDRSDADLTLELGGEAEGRAAMIWHPMPLINRARDAGVHLYNSIVGKLYLRMQPRLPHLGINLPTRGGMYEDQYLQEQLAMAVDRDTGAQWTVMPGTNGAYQALPKDYETIHWTVYIDGELTTASLRSDLAERFNRVWADAVAPDGHRINFAIAPRLLRGSVPPYPIADESNFGLGTTDADTSSGDGITALIWRLTHIGALHRDDLPGGYDEDVEQAVNEVRAAAGLEESGEVSPHLWNDILFDNAATGYSDNWAHLRPAVQRSKTEKFLRTGSGAIIGKNPDFDRHEIKRDTAISLGRVPSTRRVLKASRQELAPLGDPDWVGELTLKGGVIVGEHNPGDPLTAAMIREPQDVKAGHNVWVPNFEGGTLFQVGHNSIRNNGREGVLLVDTRARDTVKLSAVWERARETRANLSRGRGGRARASMENSDVVTPWDRWSGQTDRDWDLVGGEWNEIPVPSGSAGTLNDIDIRLASPLEYAVIVSPKHLPLGRLNRKVVPLATPPVEPQRHRITITGTPTGGTFTLEGNADETSAIAYNATAGAVQTAVRGLGGDFAAATVSKASAKAWMVSMHGGEDNLNVGDNDLTGSSPAMSVTTSGPGTGAGVPWFGKPEIEKWLRQDYNCLYSAGWSEQPCGYGSYVKNTGNGPTAQPLTGEHFDTAGVEYGPTREACLFLYIWVDTNTVLPRQQVFHQQLSGV
jgi:hypothetical protein